MFYTYTSPDNQLSKSTHQNSIFLFDEECHTGNTTVPYFNAVTDFPLDYQHLVGLGIIRKIMYLWVKGSVPIRYPF